MDKKIVLVTGASSGIGEATAKALAAAHHTVVMTGRDRKKLESMERAMAGGGQRVVAIPGDVTREDEVRAVVAEALKTFGAVHALVHSAGIFRMNRLEGAPDGEFQQVLETNLTSTRHLVRFLLPHFGRQGHGHVVAISSIAARTGFAAETAYCASKWGLMGFLAALREEVREQNVRVTAILPGPTLTPAWDSFKGKLLRERLVAPEAVASAVLFALGQPPEANVDELVLTPSRDPFGGKGKV